MIDGKLLTKSLGSLKAAPNLIQMPMEFHALPAPLYKEKDSLHILDEIHRLEEIKLARSLNKEILNPLGNG